MSRKLKQVSIDSSSLNGISVLAASEGISAKKYIENLLDSIGKEVARGRVVLEVYDESRIVFTL